MTSSQHGVPRGDEGGKVPNGAEMSPINFRT
jgi:hypothetical protein